MVLGMLKVTPLPCLPPLPPLLYHWWFLLLLGHNSGGCHPIPGNQLVPEKLQTYLSSPLSWIFRRGLCCPKFVEITFCYCLYTYTNFGCVNVCHLKRSSTFAVHATNDHNFVYIIDSLQSKAVRSRNLSLIFTTFKPPNYFSFLWNC